MSKIIDLNKVKRQSSPIKKVIRVEFDANTLPEAFIEESSYDKDSQLNIKLRNINSDSPSTLSENAFEGTYSVTIGNKTHTLNYHEAMDLYLLLNCVYNKEGGIKSITDLLS